MKREENWFLKPPPHTNILMVVEKKKVWEVQNIYEFLSVNSSVCLHAEIFNFAATAKLNFDSFFIFFSSFLLKLDQKLLAITFCEISSKKFPPKILFLQFCREAVVSDKRWKIAIFFKNLQ